ncbi:MAG: dienelactone hydrolase family protein [Ilumatobacteraceae bacterium]
MADDHLSDFEPTTFAHGGQQRATYRIGTGPAVIVIAELPGITPKVADLGRRIASIGCTAVLPHLFGVPGKDPTGGGRLSSLAYGLSSVVPACISREFTTWATNRTSPIVTWLRALAGHEHERCGGPGVGAIGMCFTGGFALAMATHPSLLVPVLSQPSLPFAVTRAQRRSIDCAPSELDVVAERGAVEGLQVLGLRFRGDRLVPAERFELLRRRLGEAFVAVELPDESANPQGAMKPHSVLTEHLIDEPGEPTTAALEQVLDLLRHRLLT